MTYGKDLRIPDARDARCQACRGLGCSSCTPGTQRGNTLKPRSLSALVGFVAEVSKPKETK